MMSIIELSPNIAYTSVLDMVPEKFDMYDLRPTNTKNDFLMIELFNCRANIKYKLSEKVTEEGSSKEDELRSYKITNYKGKKVLTTKINAGANHYLKVFVDPFDISNKCVKDSTEACHNNTSAMYMVRYSSGMEVDMVSYIPNGRGNLLYLF